MSLYPSVKIGNLFFRSSQLLKLTSFNQHEGIHDVSPVVAIASGTSLASQKKVSFELNQPGVCNKMCLKIVLEETGGANDVTIDRVVDLIERVELLGSDNRVIQNLEADEIFLADKISEPYEKHVKETSGASVVTGVASDFATITLAAGTSQTFYVNLPLAPALAHVDLSSSGSRVDVYIKENNIGGTGVLACNAVDLFVQSNRMDREAEQGHKNQLALGAHCLKYAECHRVLSTPVTLTSGGRFRYRLDSATRASSALVMAIRPADVKSGSNSTDYQAIEEMQLQDSSGRVIGNEISADEFRILDGASGYYFSQNPNLYVVKFGDIDSAMNGNQVGSFDFSGQEYIEFTNGTSTGAHVLDVWSLEVKEMYQDQSGRVMSRV